MGLFGRHHDDETDEWAYELTRKDSFPLAATITGAILILVVSLSIDTLLPRRNLYATEMGVAVLVSLAIWAIAFLVTVRHAVVGWKIGSFFVLLVVGLVAGVVGVGTAMSAVQDDLRALSEVSTNDEGELVLPPGGPRGPISKLSFAYFKDLSADARAHLAAVRALGYDDLAHPQSILANRDLLTHCDKSKSFGPVIEAYYGRRAAAVAKYRADLLRLDIDEGLRKGMLTGMNEVRRQHGDMLQRAAANEHAQIGELGAACAVLARRHWREQDGQFGFTSMTDLNEFREHGRMAGQLADEGRRLIRESSDMMNTGRAGIRRSLF
ncbi:MAG TPA: hypothetical protein VK980_10140 [Sphingomonas sp.]|nr:hypothetical protein [Sphingomonas sp.]